MSQNNIQTALKAVEKLWDAEPNTKAGDALEVLITLIEKYEAKKFPIENSNHYLTHSSTANAN